MGGVRATGCGTDAGGGVVSSAIAPLYKPKSKSKTHSRPLRLILQRYKPAGSRQDSFSAVFGMD